MPEGSGMVDSPVCFLQFSANSAAGFLPFLFSYSGLSLLGRGYCGKFDKSKMFTPGHGKLGLLLLRGKCNDYCLWICLLTFFSLPGTPLWIAFTYSDLPQIRRINEYFAPAGW